MSLTRTLRWDFRLRALIFALASTSLACLLAEMYGIGDMRTLCLALVVPSTTLLLTLALYAWRASDPEISKIIAVAAIAGIVSALAYDCFRLPFVFADAWSLRALGVPQMPLFKVFPRFGAMLLGQTIEQGVSVNEPGYAWGAGYPLRAHLVGWLYHLSNGATFGIMFATLYASAHREWSYAKCAVAGALFAAGIEGGLLLSPYTQFFMIESTATFVIVTLAAHLVFGVTLGLMLAWMFRRRSINIPS